jgi:hypothetical protein
MKPIPQEDICEIKFNIQPIHNDCAKSRIHEVRSKIKQLEHDGGFQILLKSCSLVLDTLEESNNDWSLNQLDRAIHCLQKSVGVLAKEKEKILNKKRKRKY